jgi:diguanylate cyclase (GGDEF)-like protein/PAS domain S-box-containing protein
VRPRVGPALALDGVLDSATRQSVTNVALPDSEGLYRMIVEAAREGIWLIDAAGTTTFVNQRMADLLGYRVEEMIGHPLFDFLDDEGRETAAESLGQHQVGLDVQIDFRFVRRDGTDLWTLISASPIQDVDGNYDGALAMFTDITERKRAEANLVYTATHDRLTGLANRVLLVDHLETAVGRSSGQGTDLAVLFCDLDRFKVINDSMGHAAGDGVLAAIAERLRAVIGPGDTVARMGDDEFVVCCEGVDDVGGAITIADRISGALAESVVVEGHEVFVTASIGIRVLTGAGPIEPAESLLRDADAAMYQAKHSGGNCSYVFDESLRQRQGSRLEIECDLHHALERGELRVHYQPVVSVTDGILAGVEALLRWEHPDKGMMLPFDFISVAEETGLIVPMGLWVLDQACQQLHDWTRLGAGPLTMAVNVSPRQLRSPGLASQVAEILRRTGVRPGDLCLEITETALIEDVDVADGVLAALRELGVRIALDDFGTGYSSLNHLHQFPVDVLKIDRSFIAHLGSDVEATAIVTSVVHLAQALGLEVVAEGVETAGQLGQLRLFGCQLAQGYFWGRPVPADQLDRWLEPLMHCASIPGRPSGKLTVLLADDEAACRSSTKRILERSGHFSVVAEALDGQMAVALSELHHPDLVLLDLSMPVMGGLEALPRILSASPSTRVAVISGQIGDDGQYPVPEGAAAYLGKFEPTRLVDALLVAAGRSLGAGP